MKIVNRKTHRSTLADVYVGRGSPLGNPYRIPEDGTRLQVIKKYAVWLWTKVLYSDSEVIGVLAAMHEGSILVCYCDPEPCHAEIIIQVFEWLRKHDAWRGN